MLNDNAWKHRRVPVPKRTIELIALIAISSTLFLFLHTRELHSRLRKMEVRLQPGEDEMLSANQLSSGEFFTLRSTSVNFLDLSNEAWYCFSVTTYTVRNLIDS
ncbi:hypothetical protein ANTQUA_LOCUS894 [Anthophora quadrimaculata]